MKAKYVIDYETRSEADLKLTGAYEYARHPSTELLCVSCANVESLERPDIYAPRRGKFKGLGDVFLFHGILEDPEVDLIAHNAFFERMITQFVVARDYPEFLGIPISRWHCTAAMAASHALPRKLEGAGSALRLNVQKDPEGEKLIRRHCVPQKITKNNPNVWNDDPEGLTKLAEYCVRDTATERELWHALPKLNPRERKIWKLNQKINTRGMFIDRPLVQKIRKMVKEETRSLNEEFKILSKDSFRPTQRQKIVDWLASKGSPVANLQAKTVADLLESGELSDEARRLLIIRQSVGKTSVAKYPTLAARTQTNSRLRDYLMYHGASTGRDAGAGTEKGGSFNPLNLPRGNIKNMEETCETLSTGDLEWVRALQGVPMVSFSGALRGMIRATPGHGLFCADYNAIEARVVFWIARHVEGVGIFAQADSESDPKKRRDIYREMAAKIYRVRLKDVTPEQREVGKRAILGCGFGMGWKKFMQTCETFGTPVSVKLAKLAVKTYRREHAPVVRLWYNLERAAILAVRTRKTYTVNRTKWFVKGRFLYCELPSGRRLAYCDPSIRYEKTPWGTDQPKLYHWQVDSKTKRWVNGGTYGGKLTENVVQATARDIMKDGELRIEDSGYKVLLSVYDEILAERKKGEGDLNSFENLMMKPEKWFDGCPVKAKGWVGVKYRK